MIGGPAPIRLALLAATLTGLAACGGADTGVDPASSSPTTVAPAAAPAPTTTTQSTAEPQQWDAPPEMVIDPSADYRATVRTSLGDFTIDLFEDTAPVTVNNFVFLARQGFYDGVTFHRVVPGFVIQGGDPTGTGRGGPGYRFPDELNDPRPYTRGIVAMANAGPDTNGSQFFIVLADVGLPYQYNIFGEIVDGLDVVDAIASVPLAGEKPVDDVVIESVVVDGP